MPTGSTSPGSGDGDTKATDKEKALEFKNKGNAAFQQADYQAAIYYFSKGIELDPHNPTNYILYSNRSAAYFALPDYKAALQDAEVVLRLKPDWPKGYSRKGAALVGCKQLVQAIEAYKEGLKYDPNNTLLLEGLEVATNALMGERSRDAGAGASQASLAPSSTSPPNRVTRSNLSPPSPPSPQQVSQAKRAAVPTTALAAVGQLPLREQAEWHVELYKDRIWLADNEKMFRPETAYLFDLNNGSPVYLNYAAHQENSPWDAAEVVNFVLETCTRFQLRPKSVNLSDPRLHRQGETSFHQMAVPCTAKQLPQPLRAALLDHIRGEETAQEEEMAADPEQRFSSVIWKRRQVGMLRVEGGNPALVQGLLRQAAAYYRSKVFQHFQKYVKLQLLHSNKTSIASVVGAGGTSHGLAYFETLEQMLRPPESYYAVSFLFTDITSIPFDDVDDIAAYGWEVADAHAYPLPLVYLPDKTTLRPTAEQLKWFEIAFGAVRQFVEATLMKPNFALGPMGTSRTLQVDTHSGPVSVVVTLPGSDDMGSPSRNPVGNRSSPVTPVKQTTAAPAAPTTPIPPIPSAPPALAIPDGAFYPSPVFQGFRPGYMFTRGPYGVGYYLDPVQKPGEPPRAAPRASAANAAQAAQAAFQKAQSQGQSVPPPQPPTSVPNGLPPHAAPFSPPTGLVQDPQLAAQSFMQESQATAAVEELRSQMKLIQQQLELLSKQNELLVKKLQEAPQAQQAVQQQQQQQQLILQQLQQQQMMLQQQIPQPSQTPYGTQGAGQPPRPPLQQVTLQQQQQQQPQHQPQQQQRPTPLATAMAGQIPNGAPTYLGQTAGYPQQPPFGSRPGTTVSAVGTPSYNPASLGAYSSSSLASMYPQQPQIAPGYESAFGGLPPQSPARYPQSPMTDLYRRAAY